MYIQTWDGLGQEELPSIYGTPCLRDKVPYEFIYFYTDLEKTLDEFNFRETRLRTWHKTWIRRRFVPYIVSSWSQAKPIRTIILVGHSDEIGEQADNYKLGKARALSVLKELQTQIEYRSPGLSNRIKFETYSQGECWPTIKGGKRERRNRRVEVYALTAEK